MERCPFDVEPLVPALNEFFDQELQRDGYMVVIPTLRKALNELVQARTMPLETRVESRSNSVSYNFMELDEMEIAQQLTVYHFDIYNKIKVCRFFYIICLFFEAARIVQFELDKRKFIGNCLEFDSAGGAF